MPLTLGSEVQAGGDIFGGLFSGLSSLEAGKTAAAADTAQAGIYASEASQYAEDIQYAKESGMLQQYAAARQAQQVQGKGQAIAAGSGLREAGSAASVLHENVMQAGLASGVIGMQTMIKMNDLQAQEVVAGEEQQAALDAAKAAKSQGMMGLFGGIAKGLFSAAGALI